VDVEELVSAVSRRVEDLRRGVIIFVPPGSSRFETVRRLQEEKLVDVVYAYKEEAGVSSYRDVEQLAEAVVEKFRRAGDRPVYRVAVVPRSTLDAIRLAERLREAEREELQVKILYLPKYYAEAAGELEEELRALAEVEHDRLKTAAEGEYRGISPKPLQISDKEKLKKLLEARKTLEELSPGKLGLKDVLTEAFGKALKAVPGAAAASALGGFVGYVIGNLLGWAAEMTSSKFIEKLASSVLEGWGRDDVRDKVAAGIAELLRRAERAAEVLKDGEVADVLEAFLDQLALEWGMDAESFTAFMENLARLKRRRIATEDDLERFKKELAERLKEVYRELEGRLAPLGVVAGVYHVPEQLGVYFGEGEIYVGNVLAKDRAVYVEHPAEEVLAEKLSLRQLVVVHGPKGEGKSVLTKVSLAKKIVADRAVVVEVAERNVAKLKQVIDEIRGAGREPILYFDPSQPGHYPQRPWEGARHMPLSIEELALLEAVGAVARDKGVAGVVVLSDDTYTRASDRLGEHAAVEVRSDDILFLQRLVESYSGCPGESVAEVAKEVGKYGDNRALAAALAGDWLKREGCRREAVAEALRRAQVRAVDFALDYIWYAVLGGDRKKANVYAPLIVLRGLYGPIPVKLAERILIDLGKSSDEVRGSEVVRWFARRHHSTLEEAIKKAALSPVNREKIDPEELYQALVGGFDELMKSGLIMKVKEIAIDWDRIIDLMSSGLAGDMSHLSEEEKRRCAKRAALVLGRALAGHPWLPRREDLPKEVEAVLGEALEPCVVDDYMTADGMVALLFERFVISMYEEAGRLYLKGAPAEATKMLQEAARIFSPLASAASIIGIETSKALIDSWRRRGFTLPEVFYALGLLALAAGAEVDEETADLLLYAASPAVPWVIHPAAVLPVLAALRSLGEKAPHRYVTVLAIAASELEMADHEIVEYFYAELQRIKDRLLVAGRRWPLVETISAYSSLLRMRLERTWKSEKDAVAEMCRLYSEVRGRGLLGAIAGVSVLAVALERDGLAPYVQEYCGLVDLVGEGDAVKKTLEKVVTARPDELKEIMNSDVDFAEWMAARSPTEDAREVVKDLWAWLTYKLASYKLVHAVDERGELDVKRLKEAAEESEKIAEMHKRLGEFIILAVRDFALQARVIAAGNWEELLKTAEGFRELWEETEKRPGQSFIYHFLATHLLSKYLVYLAASGKGELAAEQLRKRQELLGYSPSVFLVVVLTKRQELLRYSLSISVVARHMLKLLGVGEGVQQGEVVETFKEEFRQEFLPALLMLAGRLQKEQALKECEQLSEAEDRVHTTFEAKKGCNIAVAAAAGEQEAVERLKSEIEREVQEMSLLLDKVDGRTLVEVLAPRYFTARLALMLLAAVEGRAKAVRLNGLWGSARFKEPLLRRLFRDVYENCGNLNSEECRMALLKLYYIHF
jgi:hypothetical protein